MLAALADTFTIPAHLRTQVPCQANAALFTTDDLDVDHDMAYAEQTPAVQADRRARRAIAEAAAIDACTMCPLLDACRTWADAHPARVFGVIAARAPHHRTGAPAPEHRTPLTLLTNRPAKEFPMPEHRKATSALNPQRVSPETARIYALLADGTEQLRESVLADVLATSTDPKHTRKFWLNRIDIADRRGRITTRVDEHGQRWIRLAAEVDLPAAV